MRKKNQRIFNNYAFTGLITLLLTAVLLLIINRYVSISSAKQLSDNASSSGHVDNIPAANPKPQEEPLLASSETPVLMYHHVKEPKDPSGDQIDYGLSVPPAEFAKQMDSIVSHNLQSASLADIFKPSEKNRVVITFDDGYKDVFSTAFPIMKERGLTGTAFIITGFIGRPDYMTLEEVKALKEAGWTIGSHTLDHPDLSKSTAEKNVREINESKLFLESSLGIAIDTFCYPAGKYTSDVTTLVREAGYKFAVTTKSGKHNLVENSLTLSRVRINGPESVGSFNNKLYK